MDWGRVLFTDESSVSTFSSERVQVWRASGMRNEPEYFQKRKRSGRVSVSVWGCLSLTGLGTLHRIPGHLNGESYRDLLEHVMTPNVLDFHFPDGYFIFQQDNCGIHRSHIVREWLSQQAFEVMTWPSNSPDLNPIENVWASLKRRRNNNIVAAEPLWLDICRVWDELAADPTFAVNLINSMPDRMMEVIRLNGDITKY